MCNEQYLLQALPVGSRAFRVLLPCWWMHRTHDEVFRETFPPYDPAVHRPGSIFWAERVDDYADHQRPGRRTIW